jgi:hypothetical protein
MGLGSNLGDFSQKHLAALLTGHRWNVASSYPIRSHPSFHFDIFPTKTKKRFFFAPGGQKNLLPNLSLSLDGF